MKKLGMLLVSFALVAALGLTGCGSADAEGKGAAKEDSKTPPEMQKIIDEMEKGGMQKQFGERKDEAPGGDE